MSLADRSKSEILEQLHIAEAMNGTQSIRIAEQEQTIADLRSQLQKAEEALAEYEKQLKHHHDYCPSVAKDLSKSVLRLAQVGEVARELLIELQNVRRGKLCGFSDLITKATALLGEPRSAEAEEQA